MPPKDSDFTELERFLANYSLSGSLDNPKFKQQLRSLQKKVLALLVWHANISSAAPGVYNIAGSEPDFRSYHNEVISDICQAMFLWAQGLYKPARLVLRSAIENYYKCIGIFENQHVLSIKSVFDLVDVVKETDIVKKNPISKKHFEKLRNQYALLCGYVHTADINHMALLDAFGMFPVYDDHKAEKLMEAIREVCASMTTISAIMFSPQLHAMHHINKDAILDALSRDTKRWLSQSSVT